MFFFQRQLPGFGRFNYIAGTESENIGHAAIRRQMFNRLMGRTVFADTYRIMGQDINDPNTHQSCQTHGRTHIIGENEERAAIGNYAAVQRHAVHYRAHRMFANAVHDVVAVIVAADNGFHSLHESQVGSGQIRRTADNLRNMRHNRLQTELRRLAGGNFGAFGNRFFLKLV